MVESGSAQLLKLGLTSEDARVLTHAHPNVVLVGVSQATEAVLQALTQHLRPPVHSLGTVASLPAVPQGTLILREPEALDRQAQDRLLQWLDGPGADTQVISLTSASLYPRVEQGTFLDTLYYRLNVMHLGPMTEA
jgi:transcriptional regulator of acetoin/glycerol metabolism